MYKSIFILTAAAFILTASFLPWGQHSLEGTTGSSQAQDFPKEETITTSHTIVINGLDITYKAVVGTQVIKDDTGAAKASIFYIAYVKDDVEDRKARPVTFCFNGGPGSSSVWLNLGIFGPKRINIDDEGTSFSQHPQLLDNPYSILDVTDLVFIDPVSTGYSRAVVGEDPQQFHGVEEDVRSIAEFIRVYITRHQLWKSPKYLAGESYGTIRAAALAHELHHSHYLYLDGILLISSVLNFATISSTNGTDLAYQLFLPSYAAIAFYHQKLSKDLLYNLEETLAEVDDFVNYEYAPALRQGDKLDLQQKKAVASRLARYTGLSENYLERANLRVNVFRFARELLNYEYLTLGRFDGRVKGFEIDPCNSNFEYDPSLELILGPFTAVFNEYIRGDLKWKSDEEYKVITNLLWNYGEACRKSLNVTDKLKEVMVKEPGLKVYVAGGYQDLATPYAGAEYTLGHLGLDPALRDNIVFRIYDGGHMMYLYQPTLMRMKEDIADFIQQRK